MTRQITPLPPFPEPRATPDLTWPAWLLVCLAVTALWLGWDEITSHARISLARRAEPTTIEQAVQK